jgi:2-isopropylmalate synthase
MSTTVETTEVSTPDVKTQVEENGKVGTQLPPVPPVQGNTPLNGMGMLANPQQKYRPFPPVPLKDRTWPDKQITSPPIWCSVDLRDGNQALADPMSIEQKLEMFATLVKIGFKEIEIGFPSASQIEFDFCRRLIDENRIPADVTIQILVQCREELIRRSFEALQGAHRAIVHIYNSTNPAQRRIVFGMSRDEIKGIAVRGAELVRECAQANPETEWVLQYSPESFVLTELDFSLEICEAVVDVWQPTPERKIILNLPTTVESATPNVHADQIEWFCRNIRNRESAIISLHTHNDRGTGVASTELALMAGAERVEGTLFGNGERTGNLDIVTVALNMYSQGVHPNLDFSDLPTIREVYERCTGMTVPERQPYAGDLVFTAFSGSHQDAINKGFAQQVVSPCPPQARMDAIDKGITQQEATALWEVPYLPIDPKDIGRSYEAIIRINTQSGKGGVAYVLEQKFGLNLPKAMHKEFGAVINRLADEKGHEISRDDIYKAFVREYIKRLTPFEVLSFHSSGISDGERTSKHTVDAEARIVMNGEQRDIRGRGNGPIDAFVVALQEAGAPQFELRSYAEHSLSEGAEAKAVAYIQIRTERGEFFGAAIDTDIEFASIKAVVSALNRAMS